MPYLRENPASGTLGDGALRAEAGNLKSKNSTDRRPVLLYHAPGEPAPSPIRVGARELEMVRALDSKSRTRVELVRIRPRLGLNATGTIARLRRKGIPVESVWHKITDDEGMTVRFVSYWLTGKVLGVEP